MTTLTNKTRTTKPSFMRRQGGIRGATPVRPHFFPELAEVEPKTAEQRIAEYREKQRNNSQAREFERFFGIINCINDHFAAEAEAVIDWSARRMIVTVDQGGKTVYSATAEMDSPAIEAKIRLIRHELEQMKVAALVGLKGAA